MLCLYVYGLQQYGQLNNSCPLWCFYIKANTLTNVKEYEKNDKFEIRGKTDEFDTIGQKKI